MEITLKRRGVLFCLVGPAGSGKSVLGERILREHAGSIRQSISVTSRAPRSGEKEGVSYYFVSMAEFKKRAQNGDFFEWEENHGQLYGTLRSTVLDALQSGQDLLLIIDIKGALNMKKQLPRDTVIAFVTTPTFGMLKERILGRGKISEKELATRLETAKEEYAQLLKATEEPGVVDYFIVNDTIEKAARDFSAIISAERLRVLRLEGLEKICSIESA